MNYEHLSIAELRKKIFEAQNETIANSLLETLWHKDAQAEKELRTMVASLKNDVLSDELYEQARQIVITHRIDLSMDNKESDFLWWQKKLYTKVFLHTVYHKDIIAQLRAVSPHIVFNGGYYPDMDSLPPWLNERDSYDVRRGKLIDK